MTDNDRQLMSKVKKKIGYHIDHEFFTAVLVSIIVCLNRLYIEYKWIQVYTRFCVIDGVIVVAVAVVVDIAVTIIIVIVVVVVVTIDV